MNPYFQMLKKDHEEAKGICGQFKETNYPPLQTKKESCEDAREGMAEYHVNDWVIKEIETMPKGEEQRQMLEQIIQQGI